MKRLLREYYERVTTLKMGAAIIPGRETPGSK
jgi:hypothetical protein